MFELGDIFESEITTHAFIIGSIVFIALNVLFGASLGLMRAGSHRPSSRRATRMQMVATLAIAAAFLAAGVGVGTNSIISYRKAAAMAAPANTISIEEIYRQIDMKTLPVQDIKDLI